jgi:hypothetical protein
MTPTSKYIDYLYDPALPAQALPSPAQIKADLAGWKANAVVAAVSPSSTLGQFMIRLFGQPDTHMGRVLGWKFKPGAGYASG